MKVQRYTWEDTVIDAQTAGLITNGALMVCLKLARAINWEPTEPSRKGVAGLYWKNDDAFKAVGLSRTAYYDHREELFSMGFFKAVNANLIPQVPDLSVARTNESVARTEQSVVRVAESVVRNPFSEDTLSDDVLSEDIVSEEAEAPVVAVAPTFTSFNFIREDFNPLNFANVKSVDGFSYVLSSSGVTRESVGRTEVEGMPAGAIKRTDYDGKRSDGKRSADGWLFYSEPAVARYKRDQAALALGGEPW